MKSILFTLGLCFSLWSQPASAGPFDIPDHARATREVGRALGIHRLAPDWRVAASLPSAIRVRLRAPAAHNPWAVLQSESRRMRLDSPRRLSVVAGIPEPTAAMLFGIGVVLVLQAIPRKYRRSNSDAEVVPIHRA